MAWLESWNLLANTSYAKAGSECGVLYFDASASRRTPHNPPPLQLPEQRHGNRHTRVPLPRFPAPQITPRRAASTSALMARMPIAWTSITSLASRTLAVAIRRDNSRVSSGPASASAAFTSARIACSLRSRARSRHVWHEQW